MDPQNDLEIVQQQIPFKIFSGLLKAQRGADGKLRLHGVASSTVRDRHGDTMERSAIEDMERAANENLTIFLNHSYDVPEDVAGSVERATMLQRGQDNVGDPIWDLDFDVLVNESNERAVKAFEAIENGTKLGLSIGAMIPEGGALRNKKDGTYRFQHIDLLETSIVGIPANPRSWVQNAIKELKKATTMQVGQPTISLDDEGNYEIKGKLAGDGALHLSTPEGDLGIDHTEIEEAAPCGADCPGGTCQKPKGHSGPHSSSSDNEAQNNLQSTAPETNLDDSDDPASGTVDPDVTDAKIQVITIDTDDPNGGSADSQEAGSDPGNESADDDAFEAAQPDDVSLSTTLGASLDTLEATATALVETRRQLELAQTERDAAIQARDEAQEQAVSVLSQASLIIQKLADMPVGRKAVIREARQNLSALERLYSPEVLNMMRGQNGSE